MTSSLQIILTLLCTTVAGVLICRRLQLPAILGYLLIGICLSPYALGWIPSIPATEHLAEFGVVFLMFSIGLEFSLPRLKAMRRIVLGLGFSQVLITTLFAALFTELLGIGWVSGIVLGGVLAMSSTAIVSKMLIERMELNTPHGREVMGILLFQDLAVVPFIILIPELIKPSDAIWLNLAQAGVKAILVLAILLVAGQKLVNRWFYWIASHRSSELFMLNLLLVTFGLAFVTAQTGLSMALGAFLAGMLIAETEYRYQVEEDIKPFRDVFLGLFFVTMGMRLDLRLVSAHWESVLAIFALLTLGKALLIAIISKISRTPWATSVRTGYYLAQGGEFSLVLLAEAGKWNYFPEKWQSAILAAVLLSMLAAPIAIQYLDQVIRRLRISDWLSQAAELHKIAVQTMARQEHVIICGYGRSGQNLARLLEQEGISYVALDDDPQRVRAASGDGGTIVYGDAGRKETLIAAGLMRAKSLVISFANTPLSLKILHHVQQARPNLPVVVRTMDDSELDKLLAAGATEVVPEVLEGSLMLAAHSLILLGAPINRVLKRIRTIREERYGLLRGFFPGATDIGEENEAEHPLLTSIPLIQGAAAIGKSIDGLGLANLAKVTTVRRHNRNIPPPWANITLQMGDTLILLGTPENLAWAERKILEG